MPNVDLDLFAALLSRPEEEMGLAEGALLIAAIDHPWVDLVAELRQFDRMAAPLGVEPEVEELLAHLFVEIGFEGNSDDYYDPRNSFLPDVLARRTGIPITLAIVVIEVARRVGIDAHGIGFPGHFLFELRRDGARTFVDPFSGQILDRRGLEVLAERFAGPEVELDPAWLDPVGPRVIFGRMLRNLLGIYNSRRDMPRLRSVLERMALVDPEDRRIRATLDALGGALESDPDSVVN